MKRMWYRRKIQTFVKTQKSSAMFVRKRGLKEERILEEAQFHVFFPIFLPVLFISVVPQTYALQ